MNFRSLLDREAPDEGLKAFWEELQQGYLAFEQTRRVPRVWVEPKTGRYRVQARR